MVEFSEQEAEYLRGQRLARLATVGPDGQADVAPVGFEFDGERFHIGGFDLPKTLKYRNVAAGRTRVALVVDDLASVQPWRPRGIKLHGRAEIIEREGKTGRVVQLRITPEAVWSWGIDRPTFAGGKPVPVKARRSR